LHIYLTDTFTKSALAYYISKYLVFVTITIASNHTTPDVTSEKWRDISSCLNMFFPMLYTLDLDVHFERSSLPTCVILIDPRML
jgi:hypothetical protein